MATLPEVLATALRHHRSGDLARAESLYRSILAQQPQHPDSLHFLGILAHQSGRQDEAAAFIERALAVKPQWAEAHMHRGLVLRAMGRTAEAVSSFERAIALQPGSAEAHYNLAVTSAGMGRNEAAAASFLRAVKIKPNLADAHNNLGLAYVALGKPNEAIACYRRALALKPQSEDVHLNLGAALELEGKLEEAVSCFERALALKPDYLAAHVNLGNTLKSLDRLDEAAAQYEAALKVNPAMGPVHYNLGNVRQVQGKLDDAVRHYETALMLSPGYAASHVGLGTAFAALGRPEEAVACFRRALALEPDSFDAHSNFAIVLKGLARLDEALLEVGRATALKPDSAEAQANRGHILSDLGRLDEAMADYERALALRPDLVDVRRCLGNALSQQGRIEEALPHHEHAVALRPDLAICRLNLCMAQLPILFRTEAEIETRRAAYEAALRRLCAAAEGELSLRDLAAAIGASQPFFLAYQGFNDRELQALYGALVCRATAEAYPPARLSPPPGPGEKIRVGIVSAFFRWHSNWKVPIKGWLNELDRHRFEVYGYYTGASLDEATRQAADLCDRFVHGPMPAARWRELILADAPHVLIYPEVGMEAGSVQLAAQRLAPVQCASWGHPDTTGLPTLDYYLTSALMEPEAGDAHYTERLVRLPNLSIYCEPVPRLPLADDRASLGLRQEATVFWCGQSLFKYLPQYDGVFTRIAREAGDCQFVFVGFSRGDHVTRLFRERLAAEFAANGLDVGEFCVFLPPLPQDRFLMAMGACDVFLDSIGWSGCNSTLESLAYDLPIVTLEGALMRGRHSAAILAMMGVTDTVTHALDDYVATAIRLARDVPWREATRAKLAENKHRIYFDRACIVGLEEFLERVVRGSARASDPSEDRLSAALRLHRAGETARAEALYGQALADDPDCVDALCHLGAIAAATGRNERAIALFEQAVKRDPGHADAQWGLGQALDVSGKDETARRCYTRALASRPDHVQAHRNLGNIHLRRHELHEAVSSYERALAVNSASAEILALLGFALAVQDRLDEALLAYERASALRPESVEIHLTIGGILLKLRRLAEATSRYRRAIGVKPDAAEAHLRLGNALYAEDDLAAATAEYEYALALQPDLAEAHCNIGLALYNEGKMDAAARRHEQALALRPNFAISIFSLCIAQLPIIYHDEAEIATRRANYEAQLRQVIGKAGGQVSLRELASGVGSAQPFYLAYQGMNDRALQTLYGTLVCRIMADRFPRAPMPAPPRPGEMIRVGIVSGWFRRHSNWKIPIKGWLGQLDRRRFQLFGYYTGADLDDASREAAAMCHRFVHGPNSLDGWRAKILADGPHVLIYPEVGMDPMSAQLAAQRLAPVQCNSWGHPDTSGFPTLDYYLSSALMEPADGEEHYRERLVRLPNLSIYCEPIEVTRAPRDRAAFGLRVGATVYWSGQSLFKYLPQHDAVFARIARGAGDCQFVFIEFVKGSHVTQVFRDRLTRAFAAAGLEASDHCVFLPRLSPGEFLAAMAQCDVFLDSIGWSGCNSTLESLTAEIPILTLRGALMRGRHSAAILEMMGVTDTIADTIDGFVATAVRLAQDRSWRAAIKRKIAENKHRVYRDRSCIRGLEEFIDRVARNPGASDRTSERGSGL